MPDLAPDGTPRHINLNSDTEHVRRALYDRIVLMQFSPVEDAGPGEWSGPTYTPDDSGLKVFFILSRWFATWTNLEETKLPPDQQQELVRIEADADSPFGLILHEV